MAQTIDELQADRDAIAAARQQFLVSGQVKQVSRNGRTMIYATATLDDYDRALASLDQQIDQLATAACGRRSRRALSVSF